MSDKQDILGVLRSQAWSRAKGELNAALSAYVSDDAQAARAKFDAMYQLTHDFIRVVEDGGLAE